MTGLAQPDVHRQAVLTHLTGAGLLIGDGVKPDAGGWQAAPGQSPFTPYGMLWRLGAKDAVAWSLEGLYTEGRPLMFVRCFGGTVDEAEELLAQVRARMLGDPIDIPGRAVLRVTLDTSTTTTRSDNVEVGIFEAGDYYRLRTDPAPTP